MPIRAVAFDLDGTLYPNRRMYLRSARLYLTHLRLLRHFAAVRKQVRTLRPIADLHTLQAELLAERMGSRVAEARSLIDDVIYRQWELTFSGMKPYGDARAALERLRGEGIAVHLLTDFPVGRKLEYLGLEDLFDVSMSSEDVGYLKPNPDPFLALSEAARVPPGEIAFVGNNFAYDIEGAAGAGFFPIYISAHRARVPEGVTRVRRLSEVCGVAETVVGMN